MHEITILIVDNHKILRDGLIRVIEKYPGFLVIGEATNGREAVRLCKKLNPDVVLMDVAMEELNGIEATRQIKQYSDHIKIIGLSMHSNKRFVMGMLKAGAIGYLLKECDEKELIQAIKSVVSNQKYISKQLSNLFVSEFISPSSKNEKELTPREKEILQLISEGKSSKEIAGMLFLSPKTVDAHRKNIMDKLQIYTLPELTKYAIKNGLTPLDE